MSPCPPFLNTWFGGHLMVKRFFFVDQKTFNKLIRNYKIKVLIWITSFGLLMYLRCCITTTLKKKHGEDSLVWCGLLTQLGQFFGSVLIYLLVDFGQFFKEADPCKLNICI